MTLNTQSIPPLSFLKSRALPVILNADPFTVLLNRAPSFPVILNAAQRSEESKIVANTPFTDFKYLASLRMTRDI